MEEVLIRPAREEDLPAIRALLKESFSEIYAHYAFPTFRALDKVLAAEATDGKLVGVINWREFDVPEDRVGYVFWLAIATNARRKGLGERLSREVLSRFEAEGIVRVYMSLEKDNQASRALYEKLGFVPVSRQEMKARYGKALPAIYRGMNLMPWEDLMEKRQPA